MLKKISLLLLLLPLLLCVKGVFAMSEDIVNLGYIEIPPFTYTNDAGQADGVFINEARLILNKVGYQVKAIPLPSTRLRKYLDAGLIDIFLGVKKQGKLTDKLIFTSREIGTINVQIFSTDNRKNIKLEELKHKKVITIRGYKYGGTISYLENAENDITTFETTNHKTAFEMLNSKRADYLLAYKYPTSLVLTKKEIQNLSVSNVVKLPVYFAAIKDSTKGKVILEKIEQVTASK